MNQKIITDAAKSCYIEIGRPPDKRMAFGPHPPDNPSDAVRLVGLPLQLTRGIGAII